jgi:nitrate/TMAO reductase-like tetraheme cytochrome c subunit
METKICNTCNLEKDLEEFSKHSNYLDGRRPQCKSCRQERRNKLRHNLYKELDLPETVICNSCGIEKNVEEFPMRSTTKRGYRQPCKKCLQKTRRKIRRMDNKWYKRNKKNKLKRKYGISLEEFDKMKNDQNNKCAICNVDFNDAEFNKSFPNVDHNHITGKTRGILCTSCNSGIGFFNDSIELIIKAKEYLEKYNVRD